jgi:hypothetical protein
MPSLATLAVEDGSVDTDVISQSGPERRIKNSLLYHSHDLSRRSSMTDAITHLSSRARSVLLTARLSQSVEGARQGFRTVRTEPAEQIPPHAIEAVLAAYRVEGRRLAATTHVVDPVERALRDEIYTPRP